MLSSTIPLSARAGGLALLLAFSLSGCDPLNLSSLFDSPEPGASVLTLLDTDGRKLSVGDVVEGGLSASDYVGVDDRYLEAWALKGRSGQSFSIDLMSDDFDSYLYVVGPGLSETLRDDDGAGACHARVGFTVLESGTFRVVASSSSSGQTGTYRIRVSEQPAERVAFSCGGINPTALTGLPTSGRMLEMGETSFGTLTGAEPSVESDRPVQAWALVGRAGERATIRLVSDDYDAYLYFFGPGMTEPLTDDDSAGDLDSELTVTFPETGTYIVGAGALSSGSTGSYSLTVTRPIELAELDTADRRLRLGSGAGGFLTSTDPIVGGKPLQAWAFEARAGQVVTFDLHSEDFDSYLFVAGPGLTQPLENDDGGEDLDSRLDVSFPESGVYRVIASSLGGATGAYTLRAR